MGAAAGDDRISRCTWNMDTHEIDNALLRKQYLEQHKTLTSGQIREASGLVTDVHRP